LQINITYWLDNTQASQKSLS